MGAVAIAVLWASYALGMWGYCLTQGYCVTPADVLSPSFPARMAARQASGRTSPPPGLTLS